jgi:hypothetical protein
MIDEDVCVMWHAQAAARMVDGQALIVLTRRGEVMVLNASGTWLWNLLDEACNVRDLATRLAARFRLEEAQALADVRVFVASLLEINAIVAV